MRTNVSDATLVEKIYNSPRQYITGHAVFDGLKEIFGGEQETLGKFFSKDHVACKRLAVEGTVPVLLMEV